MVGEIHSIATGRCVTAVRTLQYVQLTSQMSGRWNKLILEWSSSTCSWQKKACGLQSGQTATASSSHIMQQTLEGGIPVSTATCWSWSRISDQWSAALHWRSRYDGPWQSVSCSKLWNDTSSPLGRSESWDSSCSGSNTFPPAQLEGIEGLLELGLSWLMLEDNTLRRRDRLLEGETSM